LLAEELRGLGDFFRETINPGRVAVYDVYAQRDPGDALAVLARRFPRVIRLGLQPTEEVKAPFTAAVQDTWSGFCHGTRNREDWLQPGFGAETLRRWVTARNAWRRFGFIINTHDNDNNNAFPLWLESA